MDDPLLIGLTTGSAFLLTFLLFNHPKGNNVNANRWLGVFMCTFALSMLEILIHNLGLQNKHQAAASLLEMSRFLSAPALYLSVVFFTSPGKTFSRKMLWHFVPFLFIFLFQLPRMLTGANLVIPDRLLSRAIFTIFVATFPIQAISYGIICYIKLQRHQRNIRLLASSTEAIDLSWLSKFLLVVATVILIWLNLAFFNVQKMIIYTPALYLSSVYFLAYFSLKQKEIYAYPNDTLKELSVIIQAPESKTEKQKRLSESQIKYLREKLEHLMRYEQIYLNNELSLPALAGKMEISVHELSYLINDVYGENFFSFVNRFRVEKAKELLLALDSNKLNMLGVAFESGFNSKTSFNTSFKKLTGMSPTEFLKSSV
jgi:AraC-like DNA-binding protein